MSHFEGDKRTCYNCELINVRYDEEPCKTCLDYKVFKEWERLNWSAQDPEKQCPQCGDYVQWIRRFISGKGCQFHVAREDTQFTFGGVKMSTDPPIVERARYYLAAMRGAKSVFLDICPNCGCAVT